MKEQTAAAGFLDRLDRHKGMLVQIASAYCRNAADREDLLQTMAAELWRAYASYDPARAFSTWTYRIALNVAISFYRKQDRYERNVERREQFDDVAAVDVRDERVAMLYDVIGSLDEFDRALMLLYLQDEPYASIAEILGITHTNVATRIGRIKERLRKSVALAAAGGR